MSSTAQACQAFNKILSQPKLSSKPRTAQEIDEGVKRLRRLILVEGVPSQEVRDLKVQALSVD